MSNVRSLVHIAARQFGVALVPGAVLFAASLAAAFVKSLDPAQCDPKFGCAGGLEFVALVSGLGALLSAVGCGASAVLHRRALRGLPRRTLVIAIVGISAFLVLVFPTVPGWPAVLLGAMPFASDLPSGELGLLFASWLAVSFAFASAAIAVAKHAGT